MVQLGEKRKGILTFNFAFVPVLKLKNEKIDEWLVLLKTMCKYIFGLHNKYQIECKHFSQASFVLKMSQFSVSGSLKKVI